jgi:spermidine synthase
MNKIFLVANNYILKFKKKLYTLINFNFAKKNPTLKTKYNEFVINHAVDKETNRPIILLHHYNDFSNCQAGMFTDKDDDLVFRYLKYFRLVDFFLDNPKKVLMIGGGGYSYPKDFIAKHPNASVDVIEIDPGITKIAKKYFNLRDDLKLNIYHQDGRIFLEKTTALYDSIFIDAFNYMVVPPQLATKKAIKLMCDHLKENGIIIINIASSFEGKLKNFFISEYNTYKSIFPYVYVFKVNKKKKSTQMQNIILVASLKNKHLEKYCKDLELRTYLKTIWKKPVKIDPSTILQGN